MYQPPGLASSPRFYAYRKRDQYAVAITPPLFPLPQDALYAAREREDVLKWIEERTNVS